jgi:hypothetical protein
MVYRTQTSRGRPNNASRFGPQTIPNHLALALVGQTVSLLDRAHKVAHGVVAGVLMETGRPKLVVDRVEYDLSQVLSVTPPVFN